MGFSTQHLGVGSFWQTRQDFLHLNWEPGVLNCSLSSTTDEKRNHLSKVSFFFNFIPHTGEVLNPFHLNYHEIHSDLAGLFLPLKGRPWIESSTNINIPQTSVKNLINVCPKVLLTAGTKSTFWNARPAQKNPPPLGNVFLNTLGK